MLSVAYDFRETTPVQDVSGNVGLDDVGLLSGVHFCYNFLLLFAKCLWQTNLIFKNKKTNNTSWL